ncbi:NADH:flavin oxidoreductase/12-oxophytodienoate reductase [Metschnikowia bicuspidata var. bicuspidata NRRL YB-4993]|uniref:NADH:flavin oxidoreductase/12-oxophytodienoate reductase n=1 Tax=Metschnikowia bicuspidata var. bicuspidata NRRL YB-4993 TaxID=869754 RepID=A0A1A0H988_9ASCO|nr:NADH:flavin oxidoreductase/12-oxophytodienoate reductase [Metschnikowia bicuspidata var. bicuspidata NRRL YB-4993]OBA20452.1 NADH:flavin oxidoreductase/12-oxophytodienoate reductase [Metschnikowia bicuspidata var. bicuspidata NRRL YB-4993]
MTQLELPKAKEGTDAPYKLAAGLPYEYPLPEGVVGSAVDLNEKTPKIFQPLIIRGMVLPNRVGVSPLCQYTGVNDIPTDYHKIHYGAFALRGPGLVMVEATTVTPHAGVSPVDVGLYNDEQEAKFKEIVDFAHANTSRIGIQLAHAGRKALGAPPFVSLEDWDPRGDKDKVVAPSAVPFREGGRYPVPRALTVEEIREIVKKFGESAKRAVAAGFDFVEIHGAHGYLINEFMSAHSNKRTDQYGGSFENRIRLLVEVIDCVRASVPEDYPVFLRWSGSELHDSNPDAWTLEDSVKLAPIVVEHGVDLLDISGGGNDANADRWPKHFGMFMNVSEAVKKAVGDKAIVAAVGRMHDPVKVNELLEKGTIDFAFVGSPFMVNQGLVFDWAETLDVQLHHAPSLWPVRPKYAEMIQYVTE